MTQTNARQPDAIKLFWDRYIQHLINNNVKPTVTRWYVIRVEQYLKVLAGKRLANHSAKDVVDYLEVQSKNIKLKDWQFRQIVDAIQNLFTMLDVPWLNKVDWPHWLSSSLSEAHPTIAKEVPAAETTAKLSNSARSKLATVRHRHGEILKQLLMVIRQRVNSG